VIFASSGAVGRNGESDFHGETRSNDTHASTTDPDARLYRKGKGKEAKLSYVGNALTENRHGLVVEAELGTATGTIEREAAMTMVVRHSPGSRRLTLGADKAYDVHEFVDDLRDLNVTPHIAQNTTNRRAIDARTTHHPGYAISQQKRKRTEEPFGWSKTIGGLARTSGGEAKLPRQGRSIIDGARAAGELEQGPMVQNRSFAMPATEHSWEHAGLFRGGALRTPRPTHALQITLHRLYLADLLRGSCARAMR
jgi:hypothetical protein